MSFGKRLRKSREEKNLTQKQLADLVFLGESTISFYESDKREPKYEILEKIADVLGVSVDWLLGREPTAGNNRYFNYDGQTYDLEELIDRGDMITVDGQPISKEERERLKEHLKVAIRIMRERKSRQD